LKGIDNPNIEIGIARVSGKIIDNWKKKNNKNPTVSLTYPNPVTAKEGKLETRLDNMGGFYFEVPLELNVILANIRIFSDAPYYKNTLVGLVSGEETKIEITYNESGEIKVKMDCSLDLDPNDITGFGEVMEKMRNYPTSVSQAYSDNPEEFSRYSMVSMNEKLSILESDSTLSGSMKRYFANSFKVYFYLPRFFNWGYSMIGDLLKCKPNAEEEGIEFDPQTPSRSYYSFLKSFDLNNPQYLCCFDYAMVYDDLLSDTILGIPGIGGVSLKDWLGEVKTILADLVGFDTGLFYDMLIVRAYMRQFNDEFEPLSERQKEDIEVYFQNKEISKILLKKNEEILVFSEGKQTPVINETPVVPREKLMDTIVSKHSGNVIIVDFWATWCMPCLEAMLEYRTIKKDLKGKNVVFVYITDVSSPKKLWEEKIKGIGGEHYYLKKEEWNYLLDNFDFSGIPTYLVYDCEGKLRHKITGYPGTEKMQEMIEQLIKV
jgi:thiol-disulfide isomerase/thioredoxin